jgi:CheY-like chemotaxis protein
MAIVSGARVCPVTDPAADTERPPPIVEPAPGLTILEDRDLPGGVSSQRPSLSDTEIAMLIERRETNDRLASIDEALQQLMPLVRRTERLEESVNRWVSTMSDVNSHLSARLAEGKGHRNGIAGKRLLLVDDEPDFRGVLEREFTECGVMLTAARSAEQTEALLMELPLGYLDAALIDVRLPGGRSGFDIASDVLARHPACRVVLITGWLDEVVMREAQALGAIAASKPIQFAALKALLFP